jgi:hypothetical protein
VPIHHAVVNTIQGTLLDMPINGEKNETFGVYRTLCCGREIIIREGATFPDCPNHLKLTTVWKRVDAHGGDVIRPPNKAKSDPAA